MERKLEDPFFSGEIVSDEITIDFDEKAFKGPILVECIHCGKEFDPKSRAQRAIPTINSCSECYKKGN